MNLNNGIRITPQMIKELADDITSMAIEDFQKTHLTGATLRALQDRTFNGKIRMNIDLDMMPYFWKKGRANYYMGESYAEHLENGGSVVYYDENHFKYIGNHELIIRQSIMRGVNKFKAKYKKYVIPKKYMKELGKWQKQQGN